VRSLMPSTADACTRAIADAAGTRWWIERDRYGHDVASAASAPAPSSPLAGPDGRATTFASHQSDSTEQHARRRKSDMLVATNAVPHAGAAPRDRILHVRTPCVKRGRLAFQGSRLCRRRVDSMDIAQASLTNRARVPHGRDRTPVIPTASVAGITKHSL